MHFFHKYFFENFFMLDTSIMKEVKTSSIYDGVWKINFLQEINLLAWGCFYMSQYHYAAYTPFDILTLKFWETRELNQSMELKFFGIRWANIWQSVVGVIILCESVNIIFKKGKSKRLKPFSPQVWLLKLLSWMERIERWMKTFTASRCESWQGGIARA